MLKDFYNVLLESTTDMRMEKSIDDLTNDIILTFYIGKDEIGTAQLEYIKNQYKFIGQLSDSILDLDESIFYGEQLKGGFYIQDLWINRPFRGNGYFMNMMSQVMKFIDLNKDEYACTVLRAYSENPDVPNEKLSEIYQRFGFSEEQETEDDGIIMIR